MNEVEVKETQVQHGQETETVRTHPSFAVASLVRGTGDPVLFGSSITTHYGFVTLKIREANEIVDSHGHSTISDVGGKNLIEVRMSHAQFAELITNMNCGVIPVTLNAFNGKHVPTIPRDDRSHLQKAGKLVEERVREVREKVGKLEKEAIEALEASGLSRAKAGVVKEKIGSILQEVYSNLPYIAEVVDESIKKSATDAKIEVSALFERVRNMVVPHGELQSAPQHLLENSTPTE